MLRYTFLDVDKCQTFLNYVGSYPPPPRSAYRKRSRGITEYIEAIYNPQQQQTRFGCLPPFAYEELFYIGRL